MTSILKNVYINKLDDIVKKCKSTYHSTSKMRPFDVNSETYINYRKYVNDKISKYKNVDFVRISKYKNIFAKGYNSNFSGEVFVIKKVWQILFPGHKVLVILKARKLLERFTKENWKKQVFRGRVKIELDLPNYVTKADLKNATGIDTSK